MTVNCNRHYATDREGPLAVLPSDWPYKASSHFVSIGLLRWHLQIHPSTKPSALTLVLLHGTGSSTHSWSDLIGPLTRAACVVTIDLPGHGFTTGAQAQDLTLPAMARDLHRLLLAIETRGDVAMIGHSAGAPLAIEWALTHAQEPGLPFRLTAILGLNPSLVPPPSLYTLLLGPMVAPIATSGPVTGLLAFIAANTKMVDQLLDSTASRIPEHLRRHYRYLFTQPNHVQGAMGFMAGADLPSILTRGRQLTVPIRFLIGAQDSWVKEEPLARVIRESFPGSTTTTWPGGHLLHEERPEAVANWITSALNV